MAQEEGQQKAQQGGAGSRKRKGKAKMPTREQCPLFKTFFGQEICCKGFIPDCANCLRFEDAEIAAWHHETYCGENFTRCEIYIAYKHFMNF